LRYIHAIKGAFFSFIIFALCAFIIPGRGLASDIEVTLTVSTFLFAIIAGFFISRLNERFSNMRRLIAELDATYLSLYRTSKVYGEKLAAKIADLIDAQYIIHYDHKLSDFPFEKISKISAKLWDEIIKLKKNKSDSSYQNLLTDLTEIEKLKNESKEISSEKLSFGQWFILIFLAGIILFCLFYLKTPALYSHLITILLSTVLILALLILRDLQNFMLGDSELTEESGQRLLENIGKLRYYHQHHLVSGRSKVPSHVKTYRIGKHKIGEEPNIEVINRA
jgi:membrane protein implicated in regulation of membrane protease activity